MLPHATEYIKSLSAKEKKALASQCGISLQHLYNLTTSKTKRASPKLACVMERVTRGKITKREVLPNFDWDMFIEYCASQK